MTKVSSWLLIDDQSTNTWPIWSKAILIIQFLWCFKSINNEPMNRLISSAELLHLQDFPPSPHLWFMDKVLVCSSSSGSSSAKVPFDCVNKHNLAIFWQTSNQSIISRSPHFKVFCANKHKTNTKTNNFFPLSNLSMDICVLLTKKNTRLLIEKNCLWYVVENPHYALWSAAAMGDQLSEMEQSETICSWSFLRQFWAWNPRKPLESQYPVNRLFHIFLRQYLLHTLQEVLEKIYVKVRWVHCLKIFLLFQNSVC